MKYSEIIETMEMGKFNFEKHFPKFDISLCIHDGRTEDVDWYVYSIGNINYYIVFYGNLQVFVCATTKTKVLDTTYVELKQAQTYKGFEKNNYLIKLMYFLKTQHGVSLLISDIISSATVNVITKADQTGRFKIYWINQDDGSQELFDNKTLSKYTSLESPTKYRIIVESSKAIMPRYFDNTNPLSYGTMFSEI